MTGHGAALRIARGAILGAFALRLLFVDLALPPVDPHDEIFHYAYAAFLAETGRIPRAREPSVPLEALRAYWSSRSAAGGPAAWTPDSRRAARVGAPDAPFDPASRRTFGGPNYQTQHPPLFYMLAAGLLRLAENADLDRRILLLRIFASVCALLAIPAAYSFFRRLLPRRSAIFAAASLVALPGVTSLVGRITNDALALPLAAVLLVLLVDLARGRLGTRRAVLLCVVLAAGCWTKLSFLPLLPAPALAASLAPAARRRAMLRGAAAICVSSALLVLPWLTRQHRDTGDWFGLTPTKTASAMSVSFADRLSVLPIILKGKYWVVFGRTFLWAGTESAQGAPAVVAAALTAGLLGVWLAPLVLRGAPSPRVRRGALGGLSAVALFLVAGFLYSAAFAAVAKASGVAFEPYGLGWYAAILTPAVLLAGCASGRAVPRPAFFVLIALSLAAAWILDLGVLPLVYSGRAGFNGANAPFSSYAAGVTSPARAMRTYANVAVVPVPAGLLAILWFAWQSLLGIGVWFGSRRGSL